MNKKNEDGFRKELRQNLYNTLHSKGINKDKWKVLLFPFPKFAVLCLFSGFLLLIAGLFLVTIGIVYILNVGVLNPLAIVPLLLGLGLLSMSFITVKFAWEIWIESRPYWIFHSEEKQSVVSPFRKYKI